MKDSSENKFSSYCSTNRTPKLLQPAGQTVRAADCASFVKPTYPENKITRHYGYWGPIFFLFTPSGWRRFLSAQPGKQLVRSKLDTRSCLKHILKCLKPSPEKNRKKKQKLTSEVVSQTKMNFWEDNKIFSSKTWRINHSARLMYRPSRRKIHVPVPDILKNVNSSEPNKI